MAIPTTFAPSRFQLINDIWIDIKLAVSEAIDDKGKRKQVLGKIKASLCDRLFPMDVED